MGSIFSTGCCLQIIRLLDALTMRSPTEDSMAEGHFTVVRRPLLSCDVSGCDVIGWAHTAPHRRWWIPTLRDCPPSSLMWRAFNLHESWLTRPDTTQLWWPRQRWSMCLLQHSSNITVNRNNMTMCKFSSKHWVYISLCTVTIATNININSTTNIDTNILYYTTILWLI